jgi:hypothetical protein
MTIKRPDASTPAAGLTLIAFALGQDYREALTFGAFCSTPCTIASPVLAIFSDAISFTFSRLQSKSTIEPLPASPAADTVLTCGCPLH